MEKWKLAAIAALLCAFAGYGVFANSKANTAIVSGGTGTPTAPTPAFTPPKPSKYDGTTLPAWPSIKQWINTPAPVNLNSWKGKPVLVEVFRTECSHCQQAAPFLSALHTRYAPRGVEFVAIQSPGNAKDPENPENSWPLVQSWAKQRGYSWPVGFDAKSAWFQGKWGDKVLYPSLFLLDPSGKVVFFQSGHDDAKALQLAVELERIAPGKGDASARAKDILNWIMKTLSTGPGAAQQQALQEGISSYLGSKKT